MKFEFRNFKFSLKSRGFAYHTCYFNQIKVLIIQFTSLSAPKQLNDLKKKTKKNKNKKKKKEIALDLVIPEERENSSHNSFL